MEDVCILYNIIEKAFTKKDNQEKGRVIYKLCMVIFKVCLSYVRLYLDYVRLYQGLYLD